MFRSRILALVVTGLLLLMVCAMLYKAFDIHDARPFGIDPELPLFMLGSLLIVCVGVVTLLMRLLERHLSEPETVPTAYPDSPLRLMRGRRAFETVHLLFSPPLAILSLRI